MAGEPGTKQIPRLRVSRPSSANHSSRGPSDCLRNLPVTHRDMRHITVHSPHPLILEKKKTFRPKRDTSPKRSSTQRPGAFVNRQVRKQHLIPLVRVTQETDDARPNKQRQNPKTKKASSLAASEHSLSAVPPSSQAAAGSTFTEARRADACSSSDNRSTSRLCLPLGKGYSDIGQHPDTIQSVRTDTVVTEELWDLSPCSKRSPSCLTTLSLPPSAWEEAVPVGSKSASSSDLTRSPLPGGSTVFTQVMAGFRSSMRLTHCTAPDIR